ncbi:MAG: hypothetical protein V1720_16020 [bacterium]
MKTFLCVLFVSLFFGTGINSAQDQPVKQIVLLPFQNDNIDESLAKTLESIFRFELENQKKFSILPKDTLEAKLKNRECFDLDCAAQIGADLGCNKVICTKLIGLGEKIIVQYFLVDVESKKEILKEQITSAKVDDMETVIKRIVNSIIAEKLVTENVEVGTIMKSETIESNRRASNKNYGFSFGYLFPMSGYSGEDKVFTFDFRYGYELQDYEVGLLAGLRDGIALNIYSSYLFSKTDISPFIGGSFGFHWVSHDYYSDGYYSNKDDMDSDGFEIGLRGGLRIFRTYGFQVLINLEYTHTFNDYNDNAIVFTIGFL